MSESAGAGFNMPNRRMAHRPDASTTPTRASILSSTTTLADIPFVESVSEDLQCGICYSAAMDPVVTEECGHLFCRECLTTALERKKECPIDRIPLTLNDIRKDVRTARRINALSVHCIHRKHSCPWTGSLSDLDRHIDKCEYATVKCPFSCHGCEAVLSRKTLSQHIETSVNAHILLLCSATARLQEENMALTQQVDILQRDDLRFTWVITNFDGKRGPVYSRKFSGRGAMWYLGVDFEGPEQHAGVYLFAEGHQKRVDFKLILFNQDPPKDKIHIVNDWAADYKGKGWGPLKFINRSNLANSGFVVNGCVRIGVEIETDPFD